MASKKILGLLAYSGKISEVNTPVATLIGTRTYADASNIKEVTHTGQTYDDNDYRQVRYIGKEAKEVNRSWAINLIAEVPPTPTKDRIVSCNGGGGPLGHPKVYINLDKPGNHTCGYCGLRFHKEDYHH